MALHITAPAGVNTTFEVPIVLTVGDYTSTPGTLTIEVRDGQVQDFRPDLAEALREMAAAVERAPLDDDEEEVPDAAAHG
jgi:hypothetical protein